MSSASSSSQKLIEEAAAKVEIRAELRRKQTKAKESTKPRTVAVLSDTTEGFSSKVEDNGLKPDVSDQNNLENVTVPSNEASHFDVNIASEEAVTATVLPTASTLSAAEAASIEIWSDNLSLESSLGVYKRLATSMVNGFPMFKLSSPQHTRFLYR